MAEIPAIPEEAGKPVIVRVKRKVNQSALDAFWLEIHERPLKRPLLDFGKLSISDASSSRVEELKTKKILVRHVETVLTSKETFEVLQSFMPNSSGELKSEKNEERRLRVKTVNKHDQLLVKAKQRQEVASRHARFEQIWKSRKGKKEASEDEAIYDMCRLYDVVRVDVEEHVVEVQNEKDTDDFRMMSDYLPLLREVLPTAAEEIESDIQDIMSQKQASSDGYVYDFYAVKGDIKEMEADSTSLFPLVQVDDLDDYYDGPDDSECESDDSNAEDNPRNDYPDEEMSEDENEESEGESRTSESESEELESGSQVSYEHENEKLEVYDWSDNGNEFFEDESNSEGDDW